MKSFVSVLAEHYHYVRHADHYSLDILVSHKTFSNRNVRSLEILPNMVSADLSFVKHFDHWQDMSLKF